MTKPQGPVRRAGEIWTEEDNQLLIEGLRTGLQLEEIAARLRRGTAAVGSHCRQLMPPGERRTAAAAEQWLRAQLADDPDFDWRAQLRAAAERTGSFYWDTAADDTVRSGWEQRRPLAELVAATGASELEVARRTLQLGLAESTTDVAQRLGCAPDGTLALRVRMSIDRAAAAVWILIVDGLAVGGQRARPLETEETGRIHRHISTHTDQDDAEVTLDRLLTAQLEKKGHLDGVTVTIAERTVGEVGGDTHHYRPENPAPDHEASDPIAAPDRHRLGTP
ncbi:hypothetical protein [Amycolatopsis sp. NPDC058986]|uniref:hypothetical protein n=1 Tax=unclassified Amycolatopsis TaxID=2618356 RepID=UPI00366E86DF